MRSRLTDSVEAEDKVSQTIVRDQDFNPMPEPGAGGIANRLNWLRAGVMGANDGIVSTAAMVVGVRSEEHTSELQSLMRISYAVFCLKKNNTTTIIIRRNIYNR